MTAVPMLCLESKQRVIPGTIEDVAVLNELDESMTKVELVGNDGEAGKVEDIVKDVMATL